MTKRRELTDGEAQLLRLLCDRAARELGWQRRGVRGWLFVDEVRQGLGRAPSELPVLARKGLVDRDAVADPQRTGRPEVTYRASLRGEAVLAAREAREARALSAPGPRDEADGTLYLPLHAWHALRVLRRRAEEVPADETWLSVREMGDGYGWVIQTEDLDWLVRRGLAERMPLENAARRRNPVVVYRATPMGCEAVVADTATPSRVLLREPEAAGAPEQKRATAGGALETASRRRGFAEAAAVALVAVLM